jgi:hypothetical protein
MRRNPSTSSRITTTIPDVIELEGQTYFSTEVFPNDVQTMDMYVCGFALDGCSYDEMHYLCTSF